MSPLDVGTFPGVSEGGGRRRGQATCVSPTGERGHLPCLHGGWGQRGRPRVPVEGQGGGGGRRRRPRAREGGREAVVAFFFNYHPCFLRCLLRTSRPLLRFHPPGPGTGAGSLSSGRAGWRLCLQGLKSPGPGVELGRGGGGKEGRTGRRAGTRPFLLARPSGCPVPGEPRGSFGVPSGESSTRSLHADEDGPARTSLPLEPYVTPPLIPGTGRGVWDPRDGLRGCGCADRRLRSRRVAARHPAVSAGHRATGLPPHPGTPRGVPRSQRHPLPSWDQDGSWGSETPPVGLRGWTGWTPQPRPKKCGRAPLPKNPRGVPLRGSGNRGNRDPTAPPVGPAMGTIPTPLHPPDPSASLQPRSTPVTHGIPPSPPKNRGPRSRVPPRRGSWCWGTAAPARPRRGARHRRSRRRGRAASAQPGP